MRRFFTFAVALAAIGAFAAPSVMAGAGKQPQQSVAPEAKGGHGGGCYDGPQQSKAAKPAA